MTDLKKLTEKVKEMQKNRDKSLPNNQLIILLQKDLETDWMKEIS